MKYIWQYSGLPLCHITHDEFLAIRICLGFRPKSDYEISQQIYDIIKRCRPFNAEELHGLINNLLNNADNKSSSFYKQAIELING